MAVGIERVSMNMSCFLIKYRDIAMKEPTFHILLF